MDTSQDIGSNRRIAKNTLMLYIRMLISMLVGLYTSRVVLQTLGVEDYGIYGVVGGVVSMMGFLNASMSGATSRFITFELGKGDLQRVRDTFSSAMIIHVGIALAVILLAETVGLWFLCNKLVIPEGRMEAAHWVYQCSIISAAIGITQTPYTAVIMSREKMDVYAYMELLNVFLKLGIVYLLVIGNFDKLILYSFLTLVVSFFIAMLYRIYCISKFEESHFRWIWKKDLLKPMMSFSGWDLYGNLCVSARQQGINMIINIFFGATLNAAGAIASTVQGVVLNLGHNAIAACRPQIVKRYASDNISSMLELTYMACRYISYLMMLFTIPLVLEMDFVMALWLDVVPENAALFCRVLLISGMLNIVHCVFSIGIAAAGNVKKISFISGTLFLLNLPIAYGMFNLGLESHYAYIMMAITNGIIVFVNYSILRSYIRQYTYKKFFQLLLSLTLVFILTIILPVYVHIDLEQGLGRLTLVLLSTIVSLCLFVYSVGMEKSERVFVKDSIEKIVRISRTKQ